MIEKKANLKTIPSLDLIDRKILYELDLNSRATYSEIAKKIRLSKQSVKERIKKLEHLKIIKQYFALIDIYKLGYTFYRLDLRFQNVSDQKEELIKNYILHLPKVLWVAELHGKWDLAVIFLTKNIIEIDDNVRKIKSEFSNYIQNSVFSVSTTHTRYKASFLLDKTDYTSVFMGREVANTILTDTENEVLKMLAKDGRVPIIKIAEKIKKSVGSVKHAIKNLKKEKILLGFGILLNYQALGYTHYKLFIDFIHPSNEKEIKILTYFQNNPNVIFMTKSLGRADIECEIVTKTIYEFKKIVREMRRIFNNDIKEIEAYVVLEEYLTNYYPLK